MKTRNTNPVFCIILLALLTIALTSGCALMSSDDPNADTSQELMNSAHPFSDLPVHSSFTLDRSRSFIYESGSGSIKVGRLYYTAWNDAQEVVDYYQNVMPSHGWNLINAMEHDGVILNYQKEGWVCTLVIQKVLLKTQIEAQIGPK